MFQREAVKHRQIMSGTDKELLRCKRHDKLYTVTHMFIKATGTWATTEIRAACVAETFAQMVWLD